MEKLPGHLNLPLQFFFRPMPASRDLSAVFYRSMSAATKMARLRAERRLGWFKNIAFYVRRFVQLPAVNFPPALTVRDPASITKEIIEAKASEARRFWKLGNGAISDLLLLLENNGALATRGELATEYLDAFSQWLREEDTPYLFLGDDKLSAARSRFDAAHELVHLLLHRGLSPEQIQRPEIHRLVESQAHLFAGAFLLPAETFAADFEGANLEVLRLLKAKWKVSIGMMVMRAEQLNFISDQQAQRLWRSYSRRGWRTHEPLDNEIPLERPRVLRRAIELVVDSGVQSKAEILSRLPYSGQNIVVCGKLNLVRRWRELRVRRPSVRRPAPASRGRCGSRCRG